MKFVNYTKVEIHGIRSSLYKSLSTLKRETQLIESNISKVDELLKSIGANSETKTYCLQEELLNFSEIDKKFTRKVNWKEIVYLSIKASPYFLTSIMIYDKMKIEYPCQMNDKRYAMKNISCALTNLVSEGKIGKQKRAEKLLYFGDVQKHFTKDGKPNESFFKK